MPHADRTDTDDECERAGGGRRSGEVDLQILSVSRSAGCGRVRVKARLPSGTLPPNGRVAYMAPAPIERRTSFTGSALPFPDRDAAFAGPRAALNHGIALVDTDGTFTAELRAGLPGAFYDIGEWVPPSLFVCLRDGGGRVRRGSGAVSGAQEAPNRFLSHAARRKTEGAGFYDAPQRPDARSQEQILRAGAYPAEPACCRGEASTRDGSAGGDRQSSEDFWKTRPRV